MANNLREFVYLDPVSVNSLLASQSIAIPDTVREVTEDIEGEDDKKSLGGSIGWQGVGSLSANWQKGDTEQQRNLAETQQRVNDQYRFSILYRTLSQSENLTELEGESPSETDSFELNNGEVVELEGRCVTDPFYRMLSAMSMLMRIFQAEQIAEEAAQDLEGSELENPKETSFFEDWKDVLHGQRIGLKIESEEFQYPVVMSVDLENLWIDPHREFLGSHDYTVVGRVTNVIPPKKKWDFIDLLQITDSVFSEDTVESLREALADVGDSLEETKGGRL